MEREIYKKLIEWKNKQGRKPLILNGARQVGKTYILQQFGQNEYKKSLHTFINNNPKLQGLRFSMLPYKKQDWVINVPLYACLVPFDYYR